MTMRLAGVALAAVMACGWAGGASASPIAEILTFQTTEGEFKLTSFLEPAFTESFNGYVTGLNGRGSGFVRYDEISNTLRIGIDAQRFDYIYNDYGGRPPVNINRYFYADITIHPTTSVKSDYVNLSSFDISAIKYQLTYGDFGFNTYQPRYAEITGLSFQVAQAPLPSAAPLFGAAILTLGAAGYGLKRRKAA